MMGAKNKTDQSASGQNLKGFVIANSDGKVVFSGGSGDDPAVFALFEDQEWVENALCRRLISITSADGETTGVFSQCDSSSILLLFDSPGDTVTSFLCSVDFAFDIFNHILTDPYDAMVVVDAEGKIRFISPVHAKFLGLDPGEGIGKSSLDVIPNSRLPHVVKTGVAEVGQILQLNGTQRVVSRHPIRRNRDVVGAIGRVMFKGPQQAEKMSNRISVLEKRLAMYERESKRGHHEESFVDKIIGQSVAIESVRQQIRKIAPLDIPVLIQGESGTGKELVASALHMLSPRNNARMITVNAAALPATLVESELFGYEAGSFTGAHRKGRPGKFELADRGTMFLDEIGDMPMEVQSKLLRVLQDRVVERVGSERPKQVDFRLCSATNHNLEELIDEGKFRLDLFYRISPVCITIPPLADRREDIPLLLQHFLLKLSDKYGRSLPQVDVGIADYLMSRNWPGNVRQLHHEIERAFVFAEDGVLSVDDFEDAASQSHDIHATRAATPGRIHSAAEFGDGTIKMAVNQLENDLIADAMIRFRSNKKKVASKLGISRSYLYKKLEQMEES